MLKLARTIRFCLNDPPAEKAIQADLQSPRDNTFAAWPSMRGLGRYYELAVECHGHADPITGYFINIREIDDAVRCHALPILGHAVKVSAMAGDVAMGTLMQSLIDVLQPPLNGTVHSLQFRLTPTYSLQIEGYKMQSVIMRQQYEFSAAHRLHVPELNETQNQKIFGKCNNPAGHGHNYQLEVAVRLPICEDGSLATLQAVDALVDRVVIQSLDHKNLNVDVPAFASKNSSVENISQVIWNMLVEPVCRLGSDVSLHAISVWETGKTVCTYQGD